MSAYPYSDEVGISTDETRAAYALLSPVTIMLRPTRVAVFALVVIGGCGHAARPAVTTTTSASLPTPGPSPATGHAHELVIDAAACWLGGLWSDALGEHGDARAVGIRDRCLGVVDAVNDASLVAYYPVRAVDAQAVGHIADHVRTVALADEADAPHAKELESLLLDIADASRDSVRARRAADEVKADYDSDASADARRAAKLAAAPHLRMTDGLHHLLAYRGPYEADAQAIALLFVVDRLEIARGLPKHLKVETVSGPLADVFKVTAPHLSNDAAEPIPTGTWLRYLSDVAAAAGHPIPEDVRDPQNREPLAWIGTLEGLADRLRRLTPSPELARVTRSVVERLDAEAAGARAAVDALPVEKR